MSESDNPELDGYAGNEPIPEAIQCEGCEKFALLVEKKNKRINQLEGVISRAFLYAVNYQHVEVFNVLEESQKALEGKS